MKFLDLRLFALVGGLLALSATVITDPVEAAGRRVVRSAEQGFARSAEPRLTRAATPRRAARAPTRSVRVARSGTRFVPTAARAGSGGATRVAGFAQRATPNRGSLQAAAATRQFGGGSGVFVNGYRDTSFSTFTTRDFFEHQTAIGTQ